MAFGRPVNSIPTTSSPCYAGQLLFDLGHCIDDKRVQAKGPQQNICCTKSYHGLRDFAWVDEALQRLVYALWPRLLEVSPVQPVPILHVALTPVDSYHIQVHSFLKDTRGSSWRSIIGLAISQKCCVLKAGPGGMLACSDPQRCSMLCFAPWTAFGAQKCSHDVLRA